MKLQGWLSLGLLVAVACGGTPTTPDNGGGGNGGNGGGGGGGSVAALRSFAVTPTTITQGDELTLTWQGENGTVSLAIKGTPAFIRGLSASGSYVIKSGTGGYPVATGPTTYQAAIGDVAERLETTVTVNPPAPVNTNHDPVVSVTAVPTGCHPRHQTPQSCSATCTARASDEDGDALSYNWSGCATGGSSTATCTVTQPGNTACTVRVTDTKGGTATASATVEGTNVPPGMTNGCWWGGTPAGCALTSLPAWTNAEYRFVGSDPDDPEPWNTLTCSATSQTPSSCTVTRCYLYNMSTLRFFVELGTRGAGTCTLRVTLNDDWGATTVEDVSVPVI
jgi:hypothetical protein